MQFYSGDFSVNFDSNDAENNAFHLYENACFQLAEVSCRFHQYEQQSSDSHPRSQPLHNNFLYSTMLWGKYVLIQHSLVGYTMRSKCSDSHFSLIRQSCCHSIWIVYSLCMCGMCTFPLLQIPEIISNQFSLICNMSRWFSFLNEVSIEE